MENIPAIPRHCCLVPVDDLVKLPEPPGNPLETRPARMVCTPPITKGANCTRVALIEPVARPCGLQLRTDDQAVSSHEDISTDCRRVVDPASRTERRTAPPSLGLRTHHQLHRQHIEPVRIQFRHVPRRHLHLPMVPPARAECHQCACGRNQRLFEPRH